MDEPISILPVTIRLKPAEVRLILEGHPVTIVLLPPAGLNLNAESRREAHRQLAEEERKSARIGEDIDALIKTWNASAGGGGRNKLVEPWRARDPATRRRLANAIEVVGQDNLLAAMSIYFTACNRGEHLVDGKNRGYAFVDNFARRVAEAAKAGTRLWWQRAQRQRAADPRPGATARLADAFARRFLGRDRYGLASPSKDYDSFAEGAARLERYCKLTGLDETRAVESLLTCVADAHPERAYPGHLASDHTWKVLLPQWVKRSGGKVSP